MYALLPHGKHIRHFLICIVRMSTAPSRLGRKMHNDRLGQPIPEKLRNLATHILLRGKQQHFSVGRIILFSTRE
jgi:hypothetical protein